MKRTMECLEIRFTKRLTLDYLLYLPEKHDGPSPLLLFLHGMGERGSDLSLVRRHGPPRLIESGQDFPFIVAAPQCPAGAVWQPLLLEALLDELTGKLEVDPARIYVTGLSMGGGGTWALANACPGRFAGIAPICGPFTMIDPENFRGTPAWCFHGAMDDVVPVNDSLRMVRWLRQSGADVRLTLYPDAEHDSWTQAYDDPELYRWLLKHRRA